ncbi:MAG TPA: PAS domain S-box protein [Gemmatimonadales bacterium]|jgi:PAS domain S-box-containing protein
MTANVPSPGEEISAESRTFQDLLETLPVAAYMCAPDGLITYYNREASRVWGRQPTLNDPSDRWCGSFRIFSAVDGLPVPHDECWMALAIRTGVPQNGEELIIEAPDGTRVTVLAHANPIRDRSGKLLGAVNVLIDISDRKTAEIMASRLSAIVESSDDAVISKTLQGQIMSWNSGAQRLFGYTADEAIGQSVMMIIPADRQDEERQILDQLVRGERVDHYETIRVGKDGRQVAISLTSSPVRDARGKIVGASKTARDISARKHDEERLRQLHEELRAADRAKSDFLATLAHELRNPLAPMRNLVALLAHADSPLDELPRALEMFDRQLTQMTRLIDDLMDISRIAKNKFELHRERIDITSAVQHAVELSQPHLDQAHHHFTAELPGTPIMVDADPARLAQAIANLLINAAKYTDPEGSIGLTVARAGDDAVVTVTDNGIGIPPDMVERVFEMFVQLEHAASRSHGGMGIGLHLASSFVEMHGGTITASSAGPGHGSTFRLAIPLATASPVHAPALAGMAPAADRPRYRILVVDDNQDAADSLALLLTALGHVTQKAYDGANALATAPVFEPDVILLDIGMAGIDGYETARRIRREPWGADIRLFALTGWGQEDARRRSQEAGFDRHFVKPVDPGALVRALDQPAAAGSSARR